MNTQKDITKLYNALFRLEEKIKKEGAYPIHKRLHFESKFTDIYDYLIAKTDIEDKIILDAGCGVGFGSFLFASNGAKNVEGISISNLEIERANQNAENKKLENVQFKIASFEDIEQDKYDLIFCVESLKHTLNFEDSFRSLCKGLKENGKLCIVDDFFEGPLSKISIEFMKDWNLNFLIAESDFKLNSNEYDLKKEDLTPMMEPKNSLKINIQILFFTVFNRNAMLKKLFKGGLLLDKLYAKKQMKYKIITISKKTKPQSFYL